MIPGTQELQLYLQDRQVRPRIRFRCAIHGSK
jgi:hypothetical protein